MKRLIIVCEGQTEQSFCQNVLSPYFQTKGIVVEAPTIKHSHGGIVPWETLKRQLVEHLHEGDAIVTMLIDFYQIKDSYQFPGWEEAKAIEESQDKMNGLFQDISKDMPEDLRSRFVPYIQLHEFEGLLFSEISAFRNNFLPAECDFEAIQSAIDEFALEQGKDEEAEYFLKLIGILYELEEEYRLRHLTPEQIRQEGQGAKTAKIVQQLRQRLDKLLADTGGMRGDLMQKALNYLKSFWDQLFLYLKDGRYNIDNSLAERMLRPMTIERKRSISDRLLPKGRKNSLGFGSHAGVEVSVIYHTFIETCKMCGVSTLEYFKEFFKAIMQGRTDYENLLPMTIGIKK